MDIYGAVTDRIIAELESEVIPWERPWVGVTSGAIRRSNGRPYSLINQFLLGKPGEWLTFNQCKNEGGHIRKGAKSKMVIFWRIYPREKKDANGQPLKDAKGMPVMEGLPILRYYNVFHMDDCEGLVPKYAAQLPSTASSVEKAEEIISDYSYRSKLTIEHHRQNEAYYSPRSHLVSLPMLEQFENAAGYYGTAFHELTHSTGHKTLLNRFGDNAAVAEFGSDCYSREELVAEIGACSILHELGLESHKTFRNSAAYIQGWLRALKNDKRMIVSAASRAEKAIRLILNHKEDQDGSPIPRITRTGGHEGESKRVE